ncbi:hypothetical protein SDJN03_21875, partial [Cucurbita argyrosperma subsp. sororia]
MGKATRWLRTLLGIKREKNADQNSCDKREKNRWSFSKSGKEFTGKVQNLPPPPPRKAVADADWQRSYNTETEEERNEHAIAVAAASAAAADAAMAAAQAAVAVVRLTNQTRGGALFYGGNEIMAALKIQNVFRGFLRARSRSNNEENKSQPEKSADIDVRSLYSNEIEDPKIVEIDTLFRRPKSRSRRFNSLLPELADERASPYLWTMASPARFSGGEWFFAGGEECGRMSTPTAHSTPRVGNSGWGVAAGVATPTRSVYGEGYFRGYSNYPNYMASTQSFKAKLRSRSAPKQRPEVWTKKRAAWNEVIGPRNSISSVRMQKSSRGEEEGFYQL